MKRLSILIIVLLMILLITQVEDYLGKTDLGRLTVNKEQIDYYLSDFSIMAIASDGKVSYELSGRHLSHWPDKKQSQIIAPVLLGKGEAGKRIRANATEGWFDQASQLAKLAGDVEVIKPPTTTTVQDGFTLRTDYLTYDARNDEISTDAKVSITGSSGTMQSTGLTARLNQDLLRFDSNVRSIYHVK